jgi:hypothetical protein
MYKARPVYHSGQAIVRLSVLPHNQYDFMSKHVPPDKMINVAIDGEDTELCIQYEEYEHCYQLLHSGNFETYFDSQL